MFGSKSYRKTKTKYFSSDSERKRFFAIKNYYIKKNKKDKKAK
jgi:hypothetical protein